MADTVAPKPQQDEVADKRTPLQIAKYWQQQLELAEKDTKDWFESGDKVIERYKAGKDKKTARGKRLNILYSNVEHLRAALYGKSAVPDVRRRFGAEADIYQTVAEVLEKALVYCNEVYDADKPIELAVQDYLLPGRGVVKVCYEPVIEGEQIAEQNVYEEYVYWKDFLCMPARTWADIQKDGWVSFKHKMTRDDLRKNFPDIADEVPLNWVPDGVDKTKSDDTLKKAEVFEIWDKSDRKRYWIVKSFPQPLRVDDDPYGLEDFFPLPEPLAYYQTTDSLVPEPEFHVYQDQADDLDEIIARISRLTRALKRRGVYDASVKELARLANAGDNVFLPAENYQALATKGGLAAAFQAEDISGIAQVLLQLYQQRDMLIQAIWEICGISDIQRGASNPNETLGAQQLKAQFGSQRLMRRQRSVQKWVRDLLKLKAEIIAEHFEPQMLQDMTGVTLVPQPPQPGQDPNQAMQKAQEAQQIIQILRSDKLRSYRIEVETDSTVFEDAEAEKKSRSEMVQAITTFVQGWGPAVQMQPSLAPLGFELLKFGVGGFKATRAIEDAIEQAATEFEQHAQQQQANPQPNPEQQKMQAEMQLKQQEMQGRAQLNQQETAQRLALEKQKAEHEMMLKEREHAHQMQMDQLKLQHQAQQSEAEFGFKREMEGRAHDMSREMAQQKLAKTDFAGVDVTGEELVQALAQAMQPIVQGLGQLAQQAAATQQQGLQALVQTEQQTQQVLQAVAQSNQQVAAAVQALAAPRKRIPVRDHNGRMIEAHDVPMAMQ